MQKKKSDSPKVARDHSLKVEIRPQTFGFKSTPDHPLNEKIAQAVNDMGRVGADADLSYRRSIQSLARAAKEAVSIVAAEYAHTSEEQYLDRWSLVQLLSDLNHPETLTALEDVIARDIPPERSDDPHTFSTVGEEIMIRTTAVEGLTRLAAAGQERAKELLLKNVSHSNFSVKRASVQGYLTYGGKDVREVLLRTLPKEEHFILDIQRTDVRRVPQPQGGLHVVNRDKDELPPPL